MAMKPTDQKKALALVALALVAGVVAYTRFFRGRPGVTGSGSAAAVAAAGMALPSIDLNQYRIGLDEAGVTHTYVPLPRDPFTLGSFRRRPPVPGRTAGTTRTSAGSVRTFMPSRGLPELTGIMRSGGQAFAIINKRMVQEGEQIFGYTVTEIGRTTVTLHDETGDTVLQVTK